MMFQLPDSDNTKELLSKHVDGLSAQIENELKIQIRKFGKAFPEPNNQKAHDLLVQMIEPTSKFYYVKILKAKPRKLMTIYRRIQRDYQIEADGTKFFGDFGYEFQKNPPCPLYRELFLAFKKIYNYKNFATKHTKNWDAYKLCRGLDAPVCIYCGQHFTHTVISNPTANPCTVNDLITRPELDHFFPYAHFPIFALSFYNLIPCCHVCNSVIKGEKVLNMQEYLHPYIPSKVNFEFKFEGLNAEDGKIAILVDAASPDHDKLKQTIDFFHLEDIYQSHTDLADYLNERAREYPEEFLLDLQNLLAEGEYKCKSADMLDQIYGPVYSKSEDRELLGKLRNDLMRNIIKISYPNL